MSVAALVEQLSRTGVTLAVEGADLKVRGPRRALTADVLAELREHKQEVLAALRGETVLRAPEVNLPVGGRRSGWVTPACCPRCLAVLPPLLLFARGQTPWTRCPACFLTIVAEPDEPLGSEP